MKEMVKKLIAAAAAVFFLFAAFPANAQAAETVEEPCTISVSVDDIFGIYDGTVEMFIQTPNGEETMTFDSRTWGKSNAQSIITSDFGNAFTFGRFSKEGYELVFADSFAPLSQYTVSSGDTITLDYVIIPSEDNPDYGEYNTVIKAGGTTAEQILEMMGKIDNAVSETTAILSSEDSQTETVTVEAGGSQLSDDTYIVDGNFDFDTWYGETKTAFDLFVSLAETSLSDDSWSDLYRKCDKSYRLAYSDTYVKYVSGGTTEEFDLLSAPEVLVYVESYLSFADMAGGTAGSKQYERYFTNGEAGYETYFKMVEGLWNGNGADELKNAYETFVRYQVIYFNYYNFPYNFVDDKSYAQETGISAIVGESVDENGFTDSEQAEIQEIIGELEGETSAGEEADITADSRNETTEDESFGEASKNIWAQVGEKIAEHWFSVVLLVILLVAWLIVRAVVKKKNIDEMSEDGK
jgi:hypothetical protein